MSIFGTGPFRAVLLMSASRAFFLTILLALSTSFSAAAQAGAAGQPGTATASEGTMIVLHIDTAGAGDSAPAFAGVDDGIRAVLTNLGQYQTVALGYQLSSAGVFDFVQIFRHELNSAGGAPQQVRVGGTLFEAGDASRIEGSSVVVAPSVSEVRTTRQADGQYDCDIITSFAFIALARPRPLARVSIDTHGIDRDADNALKEAVDAIPPRLGSVLDQVPYFRRNWGIIEVRGKEVVLELGRNAGVRRGDEFLVLSDNSESREKGLLLVRDVRAVTSIASVVYNDSPLGVGDRLLDLARVGTDSTFYVRSILWEPGIAPGPFVPIVGLRQSFSRGFYLLRPFVGIEVPFNLYAAGVSGVPINLYAGGEYDVLMGRLQIVPRAALGLGASTAWPGRLPTSSRTPGGPSALPPRIASTATSRASSKPGGWAGAVSPATRTGGYSLAEGSPLST